MKSLEKLWKMWGKKEILNLLKQKEEETIRPNFSYHQIFHRKIVSYRNEKTHILMNKSVYLGLSILELSKILMYEFW